jgi:hypothetical protein
VAAELAERDAHGEIARIYAEIRRLWAVPYVSSLQRHLATRDGWLEWVWSAIGPVFENGLAQTAAWRAMERVEVPAIPAISRDALAIWGVDAAAETTVGAVCASFVRVSPVNLAFAGLMRRLLGGERPSGRAAPGPRWTPPAALPTLPAMVDPARISPSEGRVLMSLATTMDGAPFVPGLYRMLAQWPPLLAHLATVLQPHLDDPRTAAALREVNAAIDAEIPALFAALPSVPAQPAMPSSDGVASVLAALDTYRKTSPEMVVFGRMIARALPGG